MAGEKFTPLKGHCTCKAVTYEVLAPFLCTNCCHCTWCQRETGTAFALNSIIETSNFRITSEIKPVLNTIPSASGGGQTMARCPKCYVVIFSDYGEDGTWDTFVRAGTLDDESRPAAKPDVHIFTSTKVDWLDLSSERARGVPIFTGDYKQAEVWTKDANERADRLKEKRAAAKISAEV